MNTAASTIRIEDPIILRENSDDLNLLEILRAVGRTWKHCLIALVIVAIAFVGFVVVQYLNADKMNSYNKLIKFIFRGVEQYKYPNGTTFTITDLLAPAIVNDVYESNKLDEYGISYMEFRSALFIEPYSPSYPIIVHRFERLKDQKKRMEVEEVEALERRMITELDLATRGEALISLKIGSDRLPVGVINKVLADIPETWANYTVTNKGVLDLNLELVSSESLDEELILKVDYMVIGDLLQDKTRLVEKNISVLLNVEGAVNIRDSVTGARLADLHQKVQDLNRYVIDEIMSPIRSLGLSRNVNLALFYYIDKKRTLEKQVKLFQKQADLVKRALDDYYRTEEKSNGPMLGQNHIDIPAAILPQVNADAFDKVIELSNQGKSESYRQSLNNQWLSLNIKVAEMETRMAEIDQLIRSLKGMDETPPEQLKEKYLNRAEEYLPTIVQKLKEYLDITQRIYKQLSVETIGANGRLYKTVSNNPFLGEDKLQLKKNLIILVILMFLTVVIVVPVIMIRNALRKAEAS